MKDREPNKHDLEEAVELSNDLLHLRNLQWMRDDPMMYLPKETREKARDEIKALKPLLLNKIAKSGGLDRTDELLREIGNNCQSGRIQELDLGEILR